MSYYYKYNFVSPEPTFALIKEELKSYFDTGAVDDLLFPKWTDLCLKKLGKSSLSIEETILDIDDFTSRLPDDFDTVKEAWLCTDVPTGFPFRQAFSVYTQSTFKVTPASNPVDSCDVDCSPELVQAVYKTNGSMNFSFKKVSLLSPGNISSRQHCDLDCANFGSSSASSFDIRDNKFVTNFRKGQVYLIFYKKSYGDDGYQMIPDNYRVIEFIKAFIKFKVFEMLSNQVVDETYKQIENKLNRAEAAYNDAYILAETELKKQDVYKKMRNIKKTLNRFNAFEIDNRYGRR